MARPSNATVFSTTPLGIKFQWCIDDYFERGARDAVVEVLKVIVSWEDAAAFTSEAVGWTRWDGASPTLQRVPPLRDPWGYGLWCDDYQLLKTGAEDNRIDFFDPLLDNAPVQDWCVYALTFRHLKFDVVTDAALKAFFNSDESRRYCTLTRQPRPRERITSGFQFEFLPFGKNFANDADWVTVPEERSFIPDWQYDFHVGFIQIPVTAVPDAAILACANTVNRDPFQFPGGGRVWLPGELLFKGLAEPIELYFGADLGKYNDLQYLFTAQPGPSAFPEFGGWNTYQTRSPAGAKVFSPVRIKNSRRPPYLSGDFPSLFRPDL